MSNKTWKCLSCGAINGDIKTQCYKCGMPRGSTSVYQNCQTVNADTHEDCYQCGVSRNKAPTPAGKTILYIGLALLCFILLFAFSALFSSRVKVNTGAYRAEKSFESKLYERKALLDGFSGDIGKIIPEYSKLDIDSDGRYDSILRTQTNGIATYEVSMGDGSRLNIDIVEDSTKEATFFYFNHRQNGIYEVGSVKLTIGQNGAEVGDIDFGRMSNGSWVRAGVQPPYIDVDYNQSTNTMLVFSNTHMFKETIAYRGTANDAQRAMKINAEYKSNAIVCDAVFDEGMIVFLYNVGGDVFTPVGIKAALMDEIVCESAGATVAAYYWPEDCV